MKLFYEEYVVEELLLLYISYPDMKNFFPIQVTDLRLFRFNQLSQIDSHLTAKLYVDNAIDEISIVRKDQDSDFNEYNLTNQNSITLNTQAVNDNQLITKAYVDQIHQENERSRRHLGMDFFDESSNLIRNNQDNDYNDKKPTKKDSTIIDRNPTSDNEIAVKK